MDGILNNHMVYSTKSLNNFDDCQPSPPWKDRGTRGAMGLTRSKSSPLLSCYMFNSYIKEKRNSEQKIIEQNQVTFNVVEFNETRIADAIVLSRVESIIVYGELHIFINIFISN